MGQCYTIVAIHLEVSVRYFAWFDAYVVCGCTTSYYNPLFNVSRLKGVRAFSKGKYIYYNIKNIMNLMGRVVHRGGGWDR